MDTNNIFLVTNIPTPYRIPLFNELDRQLKNTGLKLKVIFGAAGYPRRRWHIDFSSCKFDYKILPSLRVTLPDKEKVVFTYRGLLRTIVNEKPKAIITNAFSIATTKIWLLSWIKKTNYIIWSGAIKRYRRPDPKIRTLHRKLLIRRAKGFIAYGTKAKEYLLSLGARPESIEIGINTVDIDFFREEVKKCSNILRRMNNKKILLFVGYLTKGKRLDLLLKSIEIIAKTRNDFILKIVGDGAEKSNLKRLARELAISRFVSFEGYKQRQELVEYYAEAHCFLFPSEYDIWGLVLVEAMAAGLPCIASINAGATKDLIIDGATGFSINFNNPNEVAEKIRLILDDKQVANRIGEEASQFISQKASLSRSAEGFIRAIEKASSS
ncbi:MAG: glycosyltransferase family 4 protein [Candidatus Jordarchaeum sp.]|uniref:glycosyltransferase family 4 protein n=1 Tax=Candidatus Jordarchaeum sp. TaxID=2823881 RepID=UPI00404A0A78